MNKQMLGIVLGIALISLVSAVSYDLIAGEPTTITLPEQYEYYSIVGNLSPVDLEIIPNGLNVTITLNKYSLEDSFEIVFFNSEKEIITEHHYSSGGSSTKYVDRNITQYVEVPNYIDREVIKEIEKEVEGEKITIKEMPIWLNILYASLITIFSIALLKSIRRNKELKGFRESEKEEE